MTNETKKLFSAPWKTMPEDHGIVQDVNGAAVAKCVSPAVANAFSSLPELYDALKGAVKEACGTCAMMHVNPDTYDFVENGCPFSEENNACDYRDCIAILRKVRDGK